MLGRRVRLAVAWGAVMGLGVRGAPLVLAAGGRPAAAIVVPAGAEAPIRTAAADLQAYVRRICQVELPVREDGRRVEGTGLYLGRCEPSLDSDLPPAELTPEASAIRVRGGNVFFAARWPTPVAFAVYGFMDTCLGVRWFAPGPLWEYVPAGTPGELTVDVQERLHVPGTSPRIWSGHAWNDAWKAWNLRNGVVLSEVVPRRHFQNNLFRVFPPAKYAVEHPEYYPLIDGKRWIPPADAGPYWRPCESNPEVQRLTVEYARNWFDTHPNIDSFSVGMDDISHLCSCAGCRALDPRPDAYEKRQFSDRHYAFVNAIAREIARTHPDRYIGTLIYSIARQPPETVPVLEPNVFGFITETCAAWWMPGRREEDHALSREWARRCRHLSRYDYYGFASIAPRFVPHAMDEQIKFDKSLGFEGMYVEVYTFLPHTAPMIWALARLQWDHTRPVDDLLDEFYARLYGPAAPIVKRYFDLLERSYAVARPGRGAWEHRNLANQALAISPEDLDAGLALLEEAANAAPDPDIRARLDVHRGALQYAGYAVKAHALSERLSAMPVTDEASASAVLELVGRMSALGAEREVFWPAAAQRQDLLGETLRGLSGFGYLATGQIAGLERGGTAGAMRALAWFARHAPDRLAQASARLRSGPPGPLLDTVRAWLQVQDSRPPTVLANGAFEDPGPNTAAPEKDWSTTAAPRGWSTWTAGPEARFGLRPGEGLDGSAAAAIASARGSACFLQTVPVQPGERYLVAAWVRPDPAGQKSAAHLMVRFRDARGAWHPRRDLEPSVQADLSVPDWQPVLLLATVPDGAAGMVVMTGARSQEPGEAVLFDDVAAHRVNP